MNLLTKILIIAALTVSLIYFFLAGALLNYRAYYKNRLQSKQTELAEVIKKNNGEIIKLRGDIRSAQSKNDSFRARIENTGNSIKERQNQLQEVQESTTVLQNRISEIKADNDSLSQNRLDLVKRNGDLQAKVTSFRERQQKMQQETDQLQEEMQKLADELAKTNKNLSLLNNEFVELSKKYQFSEQSLRYYESLNIEKPIGPPKVIKGKISAVSESQNIVIITPGESTGVTVGTEFTVYRGDKYVGKIRVSDVGKTFSTAMIISGMMKETVMVGDDINLNPY